jgi:RND superfamily putative drug exporter
LQLVAPQRDAAKVAAVAQADPAIAQVMPPQPGRDGLALIQAVPKADPSAPAIGQTVERLRDTLPPGTLVGGAVAENHDLEQALNAKTPLVIGVVLALGFLLLLVALRAPMIAAVGVVTNLLAAGAAFGVAKLIFQDGHLSGLLGFEPQGFLDAWGPCSSSRWSSRSRWTTRSSCSARPRSTGTAPAATPGRPWSGVWPARDA